MKSLSVDEFINKYIDWIDKNEWDYVYQQATLLLEYPYDFTAKLFEANIDPLPYMTTVPYSYAPLDINKVTLSSKCTRIDASAFNCCSNLKTIELPEGLEVIDQSAFSDSGLIEITLPSSLIILGPYAFKDCKDLRKINYNGTIDQMNKVRVWEEVFEGIPTPYIHCTDGDIELRDLDE